MEMARIAQIASTARYLPERVITNAHLASRLAAGGNAIAAERCGVPLEKCHTIMEKYGYTGSACIPMALDDAIELGKIKRGDLVVMIGSGVGYNMAAAAIRMTV